MRISVKVDTSALLLKLRNGEKRLAYVTANAINSTLVDIQQAEYTAAAQVIHFRTDFARRQIAYIDYKASPTLGRAWGEIGIGNELGSQRHDFLAVLEEGGTRRMSPASIGVGQAPQAAGGMTPEAITGGPERPDIGTVIGRPWWFKNLALHHQKDWKGSRAKQRKAKQLGDDTGQGPWRGKNRTYLVPGVGVFQRTGPSTSILVYSLGQSAARVPKKLRWMAIAKQTAETWLPERVQALTVEALRYAGFKVNA